MEFQGGSIKSELDQWKLLTFDPEVLVTVSGMPVSLVSEELPSLKTCQHLFNEKEIKSIEEELDNLIQEKVIKKSETELCEFVSPNFVQVKSDEGFCLILNLICLILKLNEKFKYKKFKLETIA